MKALQPPPALLAKLGSVVVHVDELLSPDGHDFDRVALQALLDDPEVREWLDQMQALAMVPVRRRP